MSQGPEQPYERPNSVFAGFLSFLIPGLGQIYQGRTGKGLLFMACLLSLFHVGEAMGNWENVYVPPTYFRDKNGFAVKDENGKDIHSKNPLVSIVNQRWHYAGQFWIGVAALPALWQFYDGKVPEKDSHPFLHAYQKTPDENQVNQFLVNSDKTPDLGWIYTVIAGMLNILVIYDAYAGPAYGPRIPREVKEIPPMREATVS